MIYDDDLWWAVDTVREKLPFCGCGHPAQAWGLVRDILRLTPFYDDNNLDTVRRLIGSEGAFEIVVGALTEADLLDHGGGAGGSWLTPDGARLLAILDAQEGFSDFDTRSIRPAAHRGQAAPK